MYIYVMQDCMSRASVTLRFPRNPIIGDKFSSRHGQKGVMSILWPQVYIAAELVVIL
jgi:DNA-directed RNA polymerase beta subunit